MVVAIAEMVAAAGEKGAKKMPGGECEQGGQGGELGQ